MIHELKGLSIKKINQAYKKKEFSCTELTQAYLDKIKQENKTYNAFLQTQENEALRKAKLVDQQLNKNNSNLSPMAGIPIALKDNILQKDEICSAASQFLKSYKAHYNAHVVEQLENNQAIVLGRTNMDEFAMGSSNENSSFGPVKNPINPEYVPGGSSGGSASAVAANQSCVALGTDTGGSVRQPASFCGITALKPTYGRISRYGVVAFASSLDQVGPMGKTVEDVAYTYEAIAGYDHRDSKSLNHPVKKATDGLEQNDSLKGKVIGYSSAFFNDGVASEVKDNFLNSLKHFESLGAKIEDIDLPHLHYGVSCYYVIAPAEASANLARYDGIRYTQRSDDSSSIANLIASSRSEFFGDEVCRRILLGTFVLSSGFYDAYYLKALKIRNLIQQDFMQAFKKVNFIATPTSPTTAFKLGAQSKDPLQKYIADMYTVPASIAGLPAISLPTGRSENKLPFGMQLIGSYYNEDDLLKASYVLEQTIGFHQQG
ncbi:MAG TPA: Asp-tRNA(Asn)/Glu-tRNA(Gln) amidotransferase subunit GatA [Oligoflexia bacterium]|nr:Asp-tRNA(Asn)/Glu-tRNA(Gln) amidotransferase subunit GatA [Oligoflexia bacterium]HMR25424.1 Asp-tRNA(Asn)/Glu-tRNA(Gln) amidotransferase subunit GatA [Oligoflexia bacterium]